jgi:hypothetical protein
LRHDIYSYDTDGLRQFKHQPKYDSDLSYSTPYRLKLHYFWDANEPEGDRGNLDLSIYAINGDGSTGDLQAGYPKTDADDVLAAGSQVNFDVFGLFIRQDTTRFNKEANFQTVYYDNLYFSTETEWTANRTPDFPDLEVDVDRVQPLTTVSDTTATIDITTKLTCAVQTSLKVKYNLYLDDVLQIEIPSVTVAFSEAGETVEFTASGSYATSSVSLWSPDDPNAYRVEIVVQDLSEEPKVLKQVEEAAWAGFRSLTVDGKDLLLNDQKCFLNGLDLLPPNNSGVPAAVLADEDYREAFLDSIKDAGVNIVRMTGGLDDDDPNLPDADLDDWYTACDLKGIMVIAGSYDAYSGDANETLTERIDAYKGHTSIVAWAIGNDWDLTNPTIKTAAEDTYASAKTLDSTRLVFLGNNGGDLTTSDFIANAHYDGWDDGSVYDLTDVGTGESDPYIINASVQAPTNYDSADGSFSVDDLSYLANALRNVGHSYDFANDSLDYQASLAKAAVELARSSRSSTESMYGIIARTPAYFFDLEAWEYSASLAAEFKPVLDALESAYEQVHVVLDVPKPDAYAGDSLSFDVKVINDDLTLNPLTDASVDLELIDSAGTVIASTTQAVASTNYFETATYSKSLAIPAGTQSDCTLKATLTKTGVGEPLSINMTDVFVRAEIAVSDTVTAVDVYPLSAAAGITALGANATGISSIGSASADRLIIVGGAADSGAIASYLSTGKRVLILEPASVSSLLGTSITLASGGEDFVNIERPEIAALSDKLDRSDFRAWNDQSTGSVPDRSLFDNYMELTTSDLDDVAILANAGWYLSKAVLVEIFPASGGSCIVNTVDTLSRTVEDPKADLYLAELIDYLLEADAHEKDPQVGPTINFASFASEKGLFAAPMLQGMIVADDGSMNAKPASRTLTGEMEFETSTVSGYIVPVTPGATTASTTMYLRCSSDVGNDDLIITARNSTDSTVSYSVNINGSSFGPFSIPAPIVGDEYTEAEESITLSSVISAGDDITLQLSGDVGIDFVSIQLATPAPADFNGDGFVDMLDYAIFAGSYMKQLEDVWQY